MSIRIIMIGCYLIALCPGFVQAQPIFRDDFDSSQLSAGWTVIRPDPSTYSLTSAPGFFQILTSRGLLGEQGTAKNLLVRPITGNFILETRLEFDPRDGQPFAGLLVYQDDGHAVSIGLVYASGERGQFRGIVMLNVGDDIDLTNRPASRYDESNSTSPDVVYLRLLRQGSQFVGAYSEDGITYRELGTLSNPLNDAIQVGLGAANGDSIGCGSACDVPIPARFDYFQVSDLGNGDGDPPTVSTLASLSIEGPQFTTDNSAVAYTAIAQFEDGESADVTSQTEWIVAPPGVGFIENGKFQASEANVARMATIVATYSQHGELGTITRTATKLLRIDPGSPTRGGNLCGAGIALCLPFICCVLALLGTKKAGSMRNMRSGALNSTSEA